MDLDRGDDMKSFTLSHEDTQFKDQLRMRISGATVSPRFTWKLAI